jgi:hypothetical protein
MTDIAPRQTLLEELDHRQNELLDELDRLNQQIEQVLAGCLSWRQPIAGSPSAATA